MKTRYRKQGWKRRHWLLRKLEGWYPNSYPSYPQFKISCRFNDIMRSGKWNGHRPNFHSCFAHDGIYPEQRYKRCTRGRWALVYVPDRFGNYMGRAWIELGFSLSLIIYPIYGNKLDYFHIKKMIRQRHVWARLIGIRCSSSDRYL